MEFALQLNFKNYSTIAIKLLLILLLATESLNIFEILPPEILVIIFGHLQPADIVASLFVSKIWNAFHSGFNWKEAYMATFGEVSESAVDHSQKFNWQKLVSII